MKRGWKVNPAPQRPWGGKTIEGALFSENKDWKCNAASLRSPSFLNAGQCVWSVGGAGRFNYVIVLCVFLSVLTQGVKGYHVSSSQATPSLPLLSLRGFLRHTTDNFSLLDNKTQGTVISFLFWFCPSAHGRWFPQCWVSCSQT